ncbi:hypothetical protein N9B82_03330 [Saprospiraceae bacterium]|nr:hypothetical protein [Saprospiraceae bacterium]
MKNLILLFALTLFSLSLFAQDDNIKIEFDKQPRFVIKTQPFSNLWGSFKIGVEYAESENISYDFEWGSKLTWENEQVFHHVQFRGKKDLVYGDNKNISGAYLAFGINTGQWVDYDYKEEKDYFGTLFLDLGKQHVWNGIFLEFFTGVGLSAGTGEFNKPAAGCAGCGADLQANSLNFQSLAIRMGSRIGYAF